MAERSAPTRRKKNEISIADGAERLGLTTQAIGQWAAKPGAPVRRNTKHVYLLWPDFPRWREQELQKNAKKSEKSGTFAERRAAAEARVAELAVERGEIELAKLRGDMVHVDDYSAALATILDRLMARLRSFGTRIGNIGPEVEALIDREVEALVKELHAWDEDVIDVDAPMLVEDEAA
jgi:hypothetical protein